VDASFNGCSNGWCGSRRPNARASSQPGAAPGDEVYCPVSGVILRIKDSTPKADLSGKPVYVCRDGCLRYFQAHRERVLALRGATLSS
jgi:YHS domain-containing protein